MRLVALCIVVFLPATYAQIPTNTVGAVTRIDPEAKTLALKTDAGAEVAVQMLPSVSVRRVEPGETSLNNAATIAVTDIAIGDRVLARGMTANQTVSASLIVLMSRSDINKKKAADRADWDRRGVMGMVTAVSSESIVVRSRTLSGTAQITITPGAKASIRRYEPDSVNFSDAKPVTLDGIKIGDQVRARGTWQADGASLVAEEIVGGAFKTIAAVIVSVDAQAGELRTNDIETKKIVTVKVNKDSSMRKLQPQLAQMIAVRIHPEWARTVAAPKPAAPPASGARAASASPDFQQMMDRSPNIMLADLKAGDAIVVSSTVGASADRITAITLMAGVEPILTKPGTQQMSLGAWSLDMGGGVGTP